ncbi:MAG: 4-alpha-glucanotransferase [Bryobacteraceae bacterium]|nr:4-alpha-glucanotransferase [Bryobacteraceae bacterium]
MSVSSALSGDSVCCSSIALFSGYNGVAEGTEDISLQCNNVSQSYEAALDRACEIWGIQREYWDIFGRHHVASPDVQAGILRTMGVPCGSREEIDNAIESRLWNEWSRPVDPAIVLRLSDGKVPVQLPADSNVTVTARFEWEDGSHEEVEFLPPHLEQAGSAEVRASRFIRRLLPLPANAHLGYHTLIVGQTKARLILCPDQAFKPHFLRRTGKGAGIAVSMYGLRSERNWGCGDFTDLIAFTDWAAHHLQVSFVALNPLHSIPNRQPYNTSPYLPNSSFYRNAIYLDIGNIEDISRSQLAKRIFSTGKFQSRLAGLRAAEYVEYEKVWALKLKSLKLAFREFLKNNPANTPRRIEFEDYVKSEGTLLRVFALYQALDEELHKRDRNVWIWPDWPEAYRDPGSHEVAAFEAAHPRLTLFYKYIQWQLDLQARDAQSHAKARGLQIGLYHDLALATDRCGSDLWAHAQFYIAGCRVGSPPDDFAPKGQDWAFPPPNSAHHFGTGYELFIQSIRKNCRHGGALRIDHVMRFFRLFWIPDGKDATGGVYVRDYSEDLLRILALESVRNETLVIGEDLGTVEPYIRETLRHYGILSYRLLYFEKRPDGTFRIPAEYPREALVSISTHDLPTLAGFWLNRDIDARRLAGVLGDEAAYQEQLRSRRDEKQRMLDVMFQLNLLPAWFPRRASETADFTGELHNAAVGFLAGTPSELMVLNQEDLFKDTDQQNLPGTTEQYPNWRHKMRYTIGELGTEKQALACAQMFRTWLARTGRLNQQAPLPPEG